MLLMETVVDDPGFKEDNSIYCGDFPDNLSISMDGFLAILDEEPSGLPSEPWDNVREGFCQDFSFIDKCESRGLPEASTIPEGLEHNHLVGNTYQCQDKSSMPMFNISYDGAEADAVLVQDPNFFAPTQLFHHQAIETLGGFDAESLSVATELDYGATQTPFIYSMQDKQIGSVELDFEIPDTNSPSPLWTDSSMVNNIEACPFMSEEEDIVEVQDLPGTSTLWTGQNLYPDVLVKSESSTDSSPVPSNRNVALPSISTLAKNVALPLYTSKQFARTSSFNPDTFPTRGTQTVGLRPEYLKFDNCNAESNCNSIVIDGDNDNEYDDDEICIIGDVKKPAYPFLPALNAISHQISQNYRHSEWNSSSQGPRLKSDEERLTYHLALQDLGQPKKEAFPPDGVLNIPLLRHQRIALSWMIQKETANPNCSGGILADDQGLGKTISIIALILAQRYSPSRSSLAQEKKDYCEALNLEDDEESNMKQSQSSVSKLSDEGNMENHLTTKGKLAAATLVVCPTSVLRQWAEELQSKVSSLANLSFLVYHGSNRTKDPGELAKYDVVITTYAIVSMEVPKKPLNDEDDEEGLRSTLDVVGETPCKKRRTTLSSRSRYAKDGMGIDNSLLDSVTRPLAMVRWFRVVLDEAQCIKNYRTQVARSCWGLRARRRWCLSGTPIQNAVDDLYSYFRFLKYYPYAVYQSFCSMIKMPINRNPTAGYRKLQAVLKTIMLRRTKGSLLDGKPIIMLPPKLVTLKRIDFSDAERSFYSNLEFDSREQFKEYAAAGTVKQNYVNILFMLLQLRQACDHPFLVKSYYSNSIGSSSMEVVAKLPKDKQQDLLNCLECCQTICSICNDPPEDACVTICGHVFCYQCISERLLGDDNMCPFSSCKVHLTSSDIFSRGVLKRSLSGFSCDKFSAVPFPEVVVGSSMPNEDGGLSAHSSKIKAALEILKSLPGLQSGTNHQINESGFHGSVVYTMAGVQSRQGEEVCTSGFTEKAIVFSQWTGMLDLLEVPLRDSSIQFRRLDGTMSIAAREKAVKDFNTLPEISVIIMSLKAASLGLNLVSASHVILLDLWWNPTTEDQAIDRAHRIGQMRPVTVFRLTVKDTVEDRILALQDKKREMVASAFGEDDSGSRQSRLTVDDLNYLFAV